MKEIAIVDYGMGNIRSVQKACEFLGYAAVLTKDPAQLLAAPKVILPGVGAFSDAMTVLRRQGYVEALQEFVAAGRPLLGICLGMQLMFATGNEGLDEEEVGPWHQGLGFFPGLIRRFPGDLSVKVPHIGWNQVTQRKESLLFTGLPPVFSAYFVHSYLADDLAAPFVTGISHHGLPFIAAVEQGPLMATQFHPEKSGTPGLAILNNFLAFAPRKGGRPC